MVNGQDSWPEPGETRVYPTVGQALIAERVRELHAEACQARRAQALRRARRHPFGRTVIVEGQFPCPPATQPHAA